MPNKKKHYVQQSLKIDTDLKYEIEEMILKKKKEGEELTKSRLFLRYIREGFERDKEKMNEEKEE